MTIGPLLGSSAGAVRAGEVWISHKEEPFINCRRRNETTFVKGTGIHNPPDDLRGEGGRRGQERRSAPSTDPVQFQCEPLRYKESYFVLMITLWGLFGTDINVTAILAQERARRFQRLMLELECGCFRIRFAERLLRVTGRGLPGRCSRAPRAWCTGPRVDNAVGRNASTGRLITRIWDSGTAEQTMRAYAT